MKYLVAIVRFTVNLQRQVRAYIYALSCKLLLSDWRPCPVHPYCNVSNRIFSNYWFLTSYIIELLCYTVLCKKEKLWFFP